MYYVWVTAQPDKADKFMILGEFSNVEHEDYVWPRLISDGQYEATGQVLLDDTRANKMLKELGYIRDAEWKHVPGGFWTTATRLDIWPPDSVGDTVNR